jgi:hypothetical protein
VKGEAMAELPSLPIFMEPTPNETRNLIFLERLRSALTDFTLATIEDANVSFLNGIEFLLAVSNVNLPDARVFTANLGQFNITLTPGFLTLSLNDHGINYVKIQNEGASTLLGNPASLSSTVSEITLGSNLSFVGTTLNSSGGDNGVDRVVEVTETRIIQNTYSLVTSRYFQVDGILNLQGDAALEVL